MVSVVVGSGGVSVFSSPARAVEDAFGLGGLVQDEGGDEVSDLGQAQLGETTVDVASPPNVPDCRSRRPSVSGLSSCETPRLTIAL
jgi:hypothetical protein